MFDISAQIMEQVQQMTAPSQGSFDGFCISQSDSFDERRELELKAEKMVSSLSEGFSFKVMIRLIKESVLFVKQQKQLTQEKQKENIGIIVDRIIDITDTPFLPDNYTDPFLKAVARPLIDVFVKVVDKNFSILKMDREEMFSQQTLDHFISTLRETYVDGFQLSDLVVYIEETFSFVLGFSTLSVEDKKLACNLALNTFVDQAPIPMVPSAIASPILKSFTASLVEMIFNQISP